MSFNPGQPVVCVDAGPNTGPVPLTKGTVYTIANVDCKSVGMVGLVEVYDGGPQWRATRFRPVKTTSIEIFRQMLVTPPQEVDA